MAQNHIQFPPGMSMTQLIAHFDTEGQCAVTLAQTRWLGGLRYPRCGSVAPSGKSSSANTSGQSGL